MKARLLSLGVVVLLLTANCTFALRESLGENTYEAAYALLYMAMAYVSLNPQLAVDYLFFVLDMCDALVARVQIYYDHTVYASQQNLVVITAGELQRLQDNITAGKNKIEQAKQKYSEALQNRQLDQTTVLYVATLLNDALALLSAAETALMPRVIVLHNAVTELNNGLKFRLQVLGQLLDELCQQGEDPAHFRQQLNNLLNNYNALITSCVSDISVGIQFTDKLPQLHMGLSALKNAADAMYNQLAQELAQFVNIVRVSDFAIVGGVADVDAPATIKAEWRIENPFSVCLYNVSATVVAPPNTRITVSSIELPSKEEDCGGYVQHSVLIPVLPPGATLLVATYTGVLVRKVSESGWGQLTPARVYLPVQFANDITVELSPDVAWLAEASNWHFRLQLPQDIKLKEVVSVDGNARPYLRSNNQIIFTLSEVRSTLRCITLHMPPATVLDNVVVGGDGMVITATVWNSTGSRLKDIQIVLPPGSATVDVPNVTLHSEGAKTYLQIPSLDENATLTLKITYSISDFNGFMQTYIGYVKQFVNEIKAVLTSRGLHAWYTQYFNSLALDFNELDKRHATTLDLCWLTRLLFELQELGRLASIRELHSVSIFRSEVLNMPLFVGRTQTLNVTYSAVTDSRYDYIFHALVYPFMHSLSVLQNNMRSNLTSRQVTLNLQLTGSVPHTVAITGEVLPATYRYVQPSAQQLQEVIANSGVVSASALAEISYLPVVKYGQAFRCSLPWPSSTLIPTSGNATVSGASTTFLFDNLTKTVRIIYNAISNPDVVCLTYYDLAPVHTVSSYTLSVQPNKLVVNMSGVIRNVSDTDYRNVLVYTYTLPAVATSIRVTPNTITAEVTPDSQPVLKVRELPRQSAVEYTLTYEATPQSIVAYLEATRRRYIYIKYELLPMYPKFVEEVVGENLGRVEQLIDAAEVHIANNNIQQADRCLRDANTLMDIIESTIRTIIVSGYESNLVEYYVTVIANPVEGGTVYPARATYKTGETVVVAATAYKGYRFSHWTYDDSSSTSNPLVFVMPSKHLTVYAHFVSVPAHLPTVHVSVDPPASGFVAGGGSYSSGEQVTLTALPAPGYVFDSWSGDMTSASNPLTFSMPNRDLRITAKFKPVEEATKPLYTLTANVSPAGAGKVNGADVFRARYIAGEGVVLSATAGAGYVFSTWGGDITSTAMPLSFVMPSKDVTITAYFRAAPNAKMVHVQVQPAGAGSVIGAGSHLPNTRITLTAVPASGYQFVRWSGHVTSTSNPLELVVPNEDVWLTAHFEKITLRLPDDSDYIDYFESVWTDESLKTIQDEINNLRDEVNNYRSIFNDAPRTDEITQALNDLEQVSRWLDMAERALRTGDIATAQQYIARARSLLDKVRNIANKVVDISNNAVAARVDNLLQLYKRVHEILFTEQIRPDLSPSILKVIVTAENNVSEAKRLLKAGQLVRSYALMLRTKNLLETSMPLLENVVDDILITLYERLEYLYALYEWANLTGANLPAKYTILIDNLKQCLLYTPMFGETRVRHAVELYDAYTALNNELLDAVNRHYSWLINIISATENKLYAYYYSISRLINVIRTAVPRQLPLDLFEQMQQHANLTPWWYSQEMYAFDLSMANEALAYINNAGENIRLFKGMKLLWFLMNYDNIRLMFDYLFVPLRVATNRLSYVYDYSRTLIKNMQDALLTKAIAHKLENQRLYDILLHWFNLSTRLLGDNELYGAYVYAAGPLNMLGQGIILAPPEAPRQPSKVPWRLLIALIATVGVVSGVITYLTRRRKPPSEELF